MPVPITKLNFWGVRGSTPTVDPGTWRYGGNTPCLELEAPDGPRFILDCGTGLRMLGNRWTAPRSEEHTSELQSRLHLVCRLLLEKKKKKKINSSRTIATQYHHTHLQTCY